MPAYVVQKLPLRARGGHCLHFTIFIEIRLLKPYTNSECIFYFILFSKLSLKNLLDKITDVMKHNFLSLKLDGIYTLGKGVCCDNSKFCFDL